jgi:hypothetical protein
MVCRYLVRSLPCVLEQQGLLATAEASAALAEVSSMAKACSQSRGASLETLVRGERTAPVAAVAAAIRCYDVWWQHYLKAPCAHDVL